MTRLSERDLTGRIINAFYSVYDELGYGFLENVCRNARAFELTERSIPFVRERLVDVYYRRRRMG